VPAPGRLLAEVLNDTAHAALAQLQVQTPNSTRLSAVR
jgi:hypothetical protein